jgi:LysR family transcriptional regulator, glycine cleavage system transcriptional activator
MALAPLPPLSAIRCFEAAARHLSFTRAAEELGMTQAAVSYQIKLLEERVGGPLFLRGARGVTLSDAGRRIAPAVSEAFGQLRAAFQEASNTADHVLSVTALHTFATNWLVPRLGAFQLAHPGIAVKLDVSQELFDFSREDVDVGIRSGSGEWPGLVSHGLFAAAYAPMLSPRLLEKYGPLDTPADLLDLPLIDPTDDWWPKWFAAAGVTAPDLSGRTGISVLNQQIAGRVALAGHGVAILMPAFFSDELSSGQLIQPFPFVRRSEEIHYWLVYSEARRRVPKIRAFRDWILAEVEQELTLAPDMRAPA